MEPILLTLEKKGEYKEFEPSQSETFGYVLQGKIYVTIGEDTYIASKGESIYYQALNQHQISNAHDGVSKLLIVATNSYL